MNRTGCVNLPGGFFPQTLRDHYVILAGPWTGQGVMVVESVKKYVKRIVWYAIYEGPPKLSQSDIEYIERNIDAVVVPSRYVQRLLADKGVKVDGVVWHQLPIDTSYDDDAKGYLYVARYIKRKFPPHIWPTLCNWRDKDKLYVHTTALPFTKSELYNCGINHGQGFGILSWGDIKKMYARHRVYISFSVAGGFELTPFEAVLNGALVVEPAIEAHEDIINWLRVETVPLGDVYDYEEWPYQIIPIRKYDVELLLKKAEKLQYEVCESERIDIWLYNTAMIGKLLGRSFEQFRQYLT